MAKKRLDPKAKAKRQKIIAGVGFVLLIGVLAIQVPRTMKMLNPPPAAASSDTPVSTSTTNPEGTVATPVGDLTLVDPPLVPSADAAAVHGQLVSFELFTSKDPFVPQVKAEEGDAGTVPDAGVPLPPAVAAPGLPPDVAVPDTGSTPPSTGGSGSGSSSGSGSGSGSTGGSAELTAATISVNGVEEAVQAGKDFPADDPLFTLVSVGASSVEIAVAGGSYKDGAATVTLVKGKTLTLMNTTDGARYEIRLVSVGASAAAE
jgi:hypothetical protein